MIFKTGEFSRHREKIDSLAGVFDDYSVALT